MSVVVSRISFNTIITKNAIIMRLARCGKLIVYLRGCCQLTTRGGNKKRLREPFFVFREIYVCVVILFAEHRDLSEAFVRIYRQEIGFALQ